MTQYNSEIRIPNLNTDKICDDDGTATDAENYFRNALVTNLQKLFGNDGVVVSSQPNEVAPNNFIKQIQDNVNQFGQYTCAPGTFIYDSTNKRILVSVINGLGQPEFMQVDLSVPSPPL